MHAHRHLQGSSRATGIAFATLCAQESAEANFVEHYQRANKFSMHTVQHVHMMPLEYEEKFIFFHVQYVLSHYSVELLQFPEELIDC